MTIYVVRNEQVANRDGEQYIFGPFLTATDAWNWAVAMAKDRVKETTLGDEESDAERINTDNEGVVEIDDGEEFYYIQEVLNPV